MFRRRFGVQALFVAIATVLAACPPAIEVGADSGRPADEDLTISSMYIVSSTESWRDIFLKASGTLLVPPGAALYARSLFLQGGSLQINGGAVTITQTQPGQDALLTGLCSEFNLTNGASIALDAPEAGTTLDLSQGGESVLQVDSTGSIIVTGGSSIRCTGGNGRGREAPWTTGALGGYVSAGGRGVIALGSPSTPYVEISAGARLYSTGRNGGRAANGSAGSGGAGGTGGGFSNGGMVSGYVGAGGEGRIELAGQRTVLDNAIIDCAGGRGGDAGQGGAGSLTSGSTYYYQGGGGGGGYGGGNGGSDYMSAGKGGTVADFVGSGGAAMLSIVATELSVGNAAVTLKGGDGGSPGLGGTGGSNPAYYYYYSSGGGGGGFAGGGGGSSYAAGGTGTVSGNVGAGGEANLSIACTNLTIERLSLNGTGGRSQPGATGGNGLGGGGGGGGYGGGGGGGFYSSGGAGQTSGNVGAGGNATFVAAAEAVNALNLTIGLAGGNAGDGGTGGNGGAQGGGGGGGYGGGGGAGYYNYNTPAGPGSCGQNVGRGGLALFRLAASGTLWVNGSRTYLSGGPGGNAGAGGSSSGGGGGGGGYAGSGGGGSYGAGGEGSAGQFAGDGGDAQLELYCARGSIPEKGLLFDLKGGPKGDGLTKKGGGSGGSGKGRATSDGGTPRNIPRLVPIVLGPPDGALYNDQNPQLAWARCLDPVIFPSTPDPVQNYEVAIDNESSFASPEQDVKDIRASAGTLMPAGLRGGEYFWRVRALYSDGKGGGWSATGRFLKNGPPRLLMPIPGLYLTEDTDLPHAIDLDSYFSDDLYPGDLTYGVAYEQDPSSVHAAVDGTWLDLFSVRLDWYGSCDLSVRATDRGGISAVSNNFTVTVTPANDPPRFSSLPYIEVTEDQDFRFDLAPYIDDVDSGPDRLRLSLASPNAVVEGHIITLRYSTEIGTDWINLSLSDGQATVFKLLEVRVAPANDGPLALAMPDLVTDEDSLLSLDLTPLAQDEEDAPARLRWRAEGVPPGLVDLAIDERNLMKLVPLRDVWGSCVIRLVVRDTDGAECPVNLSVKVVPVNDPPVIDAIPELAVKVNVSYQLDLRPFVSDVDNSLSALRVTARSQYADVLGLIITLRYPADESLDREVVAITVSDGRSTVARDLTVALRFPPAFTGELGVISVGARKEVLIDMTRYVDDREDGPSGLRWSLGGVDPAILAASIDRDGTLTLRSLGSGPATTSFELTVRDADGNTVNRTVRVAVAADEPAARGQEGPDLFPLAMAAVVGALIVGSTLAYMVVAKRTRKPF